MSRVKYNKISISDRERIIKAHEEGKDWRATATALGVNVRTAYEWLKKDQSLPKKKGGNASSKKTAAISDALVRWIEEDSTITLKGLCDHVSNEFQVNVCQNTMKNWLDGQLFSLKALRPQIVNMNNEENKVKRKEYVNQILQSRANGRTLIWIDETNFNLYCRRKEGRSKIGHKAHVILPACKGSNLHCIGAMSAMRIISFEHRRGSYKAHDCKQWLRRLIATCTADGIEKPTFIIDNAPVHSNLESELEPEEDIEIVRLAPYSYLLNPIELLWSSFKSSVKVQMQERMQEILNYRRVNNQGLTLHEYRMRILEEISDRAIQEVQQQHLLRYSNHVERYYAAALQQENIQEI
ncbi:uncharacterized protein [Onthophagus taurus]|uniref:uncharacterized protein n=1 Tax=Onthophagus taurus TaxID=166361 RepID=UPI000C208165|nr:uncharacterized protein LOC111415207 [Onthophagus taurus]XP_022909068.1 uncharacterized protein LOC111420323 [Onthophagus taurus]